MMFVKGVIGLGSLLNLSVIFSKFDVGLTADWNPLSALLSSATGVQTETYDFIIAGSGTAGCVLANRLSENGRHSVLVLEAGGVPPAIMNVPAFANDIGQDPDLAFQYYSQTPTYPALGPGNQGGAPIRIPLGRALGGTSLINHMLYNRGSPYDYDNWAKMTGDIRWSYRNMLPYLRKAESYLGQYPSRVHHGYTGPMYVSYQSFAPGVDQWLKAGKELSLLSGDPNGPQSIGLTSVEHSKYRGRRWSSFAGYLEPILNTRKNLKVVTNAFVTKVLFNGNRAIGVEYRLNGTDNGQLVSVHAAKEVIISAGTYNSPNILMRSGIGPEAVLNQANIPLLLDLPVGQNLQMHPRLTLQFTLTNQSLTYNPAEELNSENFEIFQRFGDGPYTQITGYAGQAFFASSVARTDDRNPRWPDIQLYLCSAEEPLIEAFQNVTLEPGQTYVNVLVYASRGKSRGTVTINPKNLNGQPIIDLNAMSDPRDVQIMLEGINKAIEIMEGTSTYRAQGARLLSVPHPDCTQHRMRSEEYWRCYIARVLGPADHPVGTCAMNAVVDSNLRVIGTRGLRVIDASIMPTITNSNLQAAIYGYTEKMAEQILHDWESRLGLGLLSSFFQ